MGRAVQRLDKGRGGCAVYSVFGLVGAFKLELQGGLYAGVFVFDIGNILVESHTDLLLVACMHAEYGICRAGDGIAQVAAVDFNERYLVFQTELVEEAGKKLVGVGASEMNVAAGVTALTARYVEAEIVEVGRSAGTLVCEQAGSVNASGAAHEYFGIILGVKVKQD